MDKLNAKGMPSKRVTKLSKNAATINTGTSPTTIFNPSLPPFKNETDLLNVPGNSMLFPKINPAAPAITMAQISKVPWIKTTVMLLKPRPFEKK